MNNKSKQIKDILVNLAIENKLPSDINELDQNVFDNIFIDNEKQKTLDIFGINGTPMRVVFVPKHGKLKHDTLDFCDMRYMHTENGQFISNYNVKTLLDNFCYSGLDLSGGVADWKINSATLELVLNWAKYHIFNNR